jgi:hypothetical protein
MDIFVDGLGDVRLHAGMARLDFFVHEADAAQPAAQRRVARLVMTPQALLQVAQGLVKAAGQMQQVYNAAPASAPAPASEAATAPSRLAPLEPGRSPNFRSA